MMPIGMQPLTNPAQALGGLMLPRGRKATSPVPRYGMTMWFNVVVPELDKGSGSSSLGSWSGCSGLSVKFAPEGPVDEGGNYGAPRYLPGKISYPEVTLERAMTKEGTKKVRAWLEHQTQQWARADPKRGETVVIELYSGVGRGGKVIHRWELHDAIPVCWTIPPLSTSGGGAIAMEKLTLAHGGFLKRVEPVPGSRLKLVEKDSHHHELDFLYNPAKITVTKSREAETKHTKTLASPALVDPNSMSITLGELQFQGHEAIAKAARLLKRWVGLEPVASRPIQAPGPAEATDPEVCVTCKQKKPDAAKAEAAGKPRVLRLRWSTSRGGLPSEMVLKSYTLNFVQFAPDGRPNRATASLTLQEFESVTIGGHRLGAPAKPPAATGGGS